MIAVHQRYEAAAISIRKGLFKCTLRHFYFTTMQNLCKFEALYTPEIQCKSHKGNP